MSRKNSGAAVKYILANLINNYNLVFFFLILHSAGHKNLGSGQRIVKSAPSVQTSRALSVRQHSPQLLFSEAEASLKAELHVPSCTVPQDPELTNSHTLLGTACSFAANSLPCEEAIPF